MKGNAWLRGLRLAALALTALAVVHLVRDTDWTVDETRVFAFDAIGAAMAWILYATLLRWYRQRALRA